jgi:thiamine pyrophosphokinase
MPSTAVVFTGGEPPGPAAVAELPDPRFVVAADAGLEHAVALSVAVDVAVGDFDSVDPDVLRAAEGAGTRLVRHPTAKDKTDLELALDLAAGEGARDIVVIGGHGGRADHWLGNVSVLTASRYAHCRIVARSGASRLYVVRDDVRVAGELGEYVTLLAWNGPARGVRTEGLRWELRGEQLDSGSSRGVSNELVVPEASVALEEGLLLVVLPGESPRA